MNAKQTAAAEAAQSLKETFDRATFPQVFCTMRTNTASGRSYEITAFYQRDGELRPLHLAYTYAKASGRRFNQSAETVFISGHGFSAEDEIGEDISRIIGKTIKGERL
jgi:hypothetical protein